jgi:hypothetical protein
MADFEQELQDKMFIYRVSRAFGVETAITPPRPGDEHGEAHLSEYSLHFEVALLRRGLHDRQTIDVGFGLVTEFTEFTEFTEYPDVFVLFCLVTP